MPNSARQKRRARSVRRVRQLVDRGVSFNPAGASDVILSHAVKNISYTGHNDTDARIAGASRAIQNQAIGTASAPRGGMASFKPAKRRYR